MEIKILVAHHKKAFVIKDDVYLPIHVGKKLSNIDLGIQGDDIGDNISSSNSIYSEMTAAYWGWKNLDADYIGLCHYRRYFTFESMPIRTQIKERYRFYKIKLIDSFFYPGSHYSFQNQIFVSDLKQFENKALSFSVELVELLHKRSYDIVIPRPYEIACSNVEQHFNEIGRDHIKMLREIVSEKYPDFYVFLDKALNDYILYAANMFIMKKRLFNDYCKMVFDILNDHINRVITTNWCSKPLEEKCYSRVSGYLAEILTSAYVIQIKENGGKILYSNSMFLAV